MILSHEVALSGGRGAHWLSDLAHGLTFARVAGAQVVIVRVESRWIAERVAHAEPPSARETSVEAHWADLLALVRACPLPTLAVVEGTATPEDVALIASCDVVLATEDARFVPPVDEPTARTAWTVEARCSLERRVHPTTLEAWSRTGVEQSARWGVQAGLVDGIFADPGVTASTARCARALVGASPEARRAVRLRLGDDPLALLRGALPEPTGQQASSSPPPELRLVRIPPPDDRVGKKPADPA